jgi:hypothetical protein
LKEIRRLHLTGCPDPHPAGMSCAEVGNLEVEIEIVRLWSECEEIDAHDALDCACSIQLSVGRDCGATAGRYGAGVASGERLSHSLKGVMIPVLDLDPMLGPAALVRAVAMLRYQALEPELACLAKQVRFDLALLKWAQEDPIRPAGEDYAAF